MKSYGIKKSPVMTVDKCNLCRAQDKIEVGSSQFCVLVCKDCHVPMLVLKEHRAELTQAEWKEAEEWGEIVCPGRKMRTTGPRKILDHWHWHLVLSEEDL